MINTPQNQAHCKTTAVHETTLTKHNYTLYDKQEKVSVDEFLNWLLDWANAAQGD